MPAGKCLICDNPPLRSFVDDALNRGFSLTGIARSVADMGGKLDPDVVGRHKSRHWVKPVDPDVLVALTRDLQERLGPSQSS